MSRILLMHSSMARNEEFSRAASRQERVGYMLHVIPTHGRVLCAPPVIQKLSPEVGIIKESQVSVIIRVGRIVEKL